MGEGGKRRNRRNRRNVSEAHEPTFMEKYKIPVFFFLTAFTAATLAVYFYY
jgi:hypothetical protein